MAISDIRDGTSKTIMLGDVWVGQNTSDVSAGHGNVGSLSVTSAPATCLAVVGPTGFTSNITNGSYTGTRWADALVFFSPSPGLSGQPAAGKTGSDGRCRLTTIRSKQGGGAVSGDYVVTVSKVQNDAPPLPSGPDDPKY